MVDGINLLLGELQSISIDSPKIELAIDESDLKGFEDIVYKNKNIHWHVPLKGVGLVDIEFISEDEYEQREA